MTSRFALLAAFLAASTSFASAQTPPPPPSDADMTAPQPGDMPPPPPGDRDPGEKGPRGPHGMPGHGKGHGRDGASFHLMMGDRMIVVECGMEALKPCIDASRPLLDLVGGAGPSALPMPPMGDMAPAPGEMTPPAGDALPPTPGAIAPPSPVN